jgi:hypothetical protein
VYFMAARSRFRVARAQVSSIATCAGGTGLGRWDAVGFDAGELVVDHQLQRVRRSPLYRETKTAVFQPGALGQMLTGQIHQMLTEPPSRFR